ncbi:MAG: hypothetical protein NTW28_02060 [Candidatus Solibacter sp.]|nr:hypothetical protein [Candidatus Solibacter sp.]
MRSITKRILCAGVVLLFALGLCRAAKFRFQDKEDAVRKQAREQLAALGITRDAAKAKYPTPEIRMTTKACMMPGETGEVVVRGKFAPGSNFIFQNDNLEVVKESQTGAEYRATLKAAQGIGPQTAALLVVTPVTAITARQDTAAVVAGRYEWTMNAANGWRVVAQSPPGDSCAAGAQQTYNVQFFRNGETTPFEKRTATLYHSIYEQTAYSFSMSQQDNSALAMGEFTALMQKLSDPKLTDAQRDALMKNMEKMQAAMTAEMTKMADPANIAKAQQKALDFGCERISIGIQSGNLNGDMRCAAKVGNKIALTGTVKFLGR